MTTVIFGEHDDLIVNTVAQQLDDPIILDENAIANDVTLSADINGDTELYLDDEQINPTSVFWRNICFDAFATDHFANDIAWFKVFIEAFKDAKMVNPLGSFIEHHTKIDQLRKLDVLMPASLITNRYEDAVEFVSHFKKVAVKPVAGGEYVVPFTEERAFIEPMMLQEFIKGDNIRTFVVGPNVYSAIAESDLDDFRLDKNFTYKPIKLSAKQNKLARIIAKTLGYKWTAIDWIRRKDELYFLEANFSPMYLYFEEQTGYPITNNLTQLLVQ